MVIHKFFIQEIECTWYSPNLLLLSCSFTKYEPARVPVNSNRERKSELNPASCNKQPWLKAFNHCSSYHTWRQWEDLLCKGFGELHQQKDWQGQTGAMFKPRWHSFHKIYSQTSAFYAKLPTPYSHCTNHKIPINHLQMVLVSSTNTTPNSHMVAENWKSKFKCEVSQTRYRSSCPLLCSLFWGSWGTRIPSRISTMYISTLHPQKCSQLWLLGIYNLMP